MHHFKNSGMKEPIKELSFFISHELKYVGIFMKIQKQNESIGFNT